MRLSFIGFRITFGFYLTVVFTEFLLGRIDLTSFRSGLPPQALLVTVLILSIGAALSFSTGFKRRLNAALLLASWIFLSQFYPIINATTFGFVLWLLIVAAVAPAGEGFAFDAKTVDWHLPAWIYEAGWWGLGLNFTVMSSANLASKLWKNGEAIGVLLSSPLASPGFVTKVFSDLPVGALHVLTWSILFAELFSLPLALMKSTRPLLWVLITSIQLLNLGLLGIPEITCAMLILQIFLFDPRWFFTSQSRAIWFSLPVVTTCLVFLLNGYWLFDNRSASAIPPVNANGLEVSFSGEIICGFDGRPAKGIANLHGELIVNAPFLPEGSFKLSEEKATELAIAQLEYLGTSRNYLSSTGVRSILNLDRTPKIVISSIEPVHYGRSFPIGDKKPDVEGYRKKALSRGYVSSEDKAWRVTYQAEEQVALCLDPQTEYVSMSWNPPRDPFLPEGGMSTDQFAVDLKLFSRISGVEQFDAGLEVIDHSKIWNASFLFLDRPPSNPTAGLPLEERLGHSFMTEEAIPELLKGLTNDDQKALVVLPRLLQDKIAFDYLSIKIDPERWFIEARGTFRGSGDRADLKILYGDESDNRDSPFDVKKMVQQSLLQARFISIVSHRLTQDKLSIFSREKLEATHLDLPSADYQLVFFGSPQAYSLRPSEVLKNQRDHVKIRDVLTRTGEGKTLIRNIALLFTQLETSSHGERLIGIPSMQDQDMLIRERTVAERSDR